MSTDPSVPLQLRVATHSEIGLVRKNNQDSGFVSPRLLLIADGMGGAAAGDLASAVAVDTISRIDTPAAGEEMLELLAGAIHRANDRLADLVEDDHNLEGMGTTVTGALFDGTELGLAHIGDSRAYLLRDTVLTRLTHDHSWVQSLVDEGKISEAEASVHPHRSLLLRVLNGHVSSEPDLQLVQVRPGDRLLFCSDGLCGLVDDSDIAATMGEPDLDVAMARLVEQAHAAGGIDNITIILADLVTGDGSAAPTLLGAAAEREVPPMDTRQSDEDTVVTRRAELAAAAGGGSGAGAAEVEDEARYNPQAPHRRRWVRPLVLLVAVLLVLGAGLGAAYGWTRSQYYVGADGAQVAIFRGVSETVPGLALSSVFEVQPIKVADLPPYYQERVGAGITASSLEGARATVQELADAVSRCERQKPPRQSPSPRPTTSGSTTAGSSVGATATPTTKPTTVSPAPTTSPSASGLPAEPTC